MVMEVTLAQAQNIRTRSATVCWRRAAGFPVLSEFHKRPEFLILQFDTILKMRDVFTLFLPAIVTIIRLAQPGGPPFRGRRVRLDATSTFDLESGSQAAPNLRSSDRIIAGLCTLVMRPARLVRLAIVFKTSTLLNFTKCW
jgi:hypothetical protein